jgi:2-polyprenyl-3-methyl-5-hydroxy-6-metoxy-1,4-benzoquinol methylase
MQEQHLQSLIRIENFPIFCNVLWTSRAEALQAPLGEISLAFCTNCGHIFNQAFEPEKMKYSQLMRIPCITQPRFQEYAASLAAGLIERHNLYGKDIVEIGCGQGDFLKILCEMGNNRGVGFDPSYIEKSNGHLPEQ